MSWTCLQHELSVGGTLPPAGAAPARGARIDLLPAAAQRSKDAPVRAPEDDLATGIAPDLAASTAEQAITVVQAAGLHAGARETWSFHIEPGFVVATDPARACRWPGPVDTLVAPLLP